MWSAVAGCVPPRQRKGSSQTVNLERSRTENRLRLRLLYSLGDIQLALSAAAFLSECDPDSTYSKVELRRFRCYETTIIVSYARPFSQARGEVPCLPFKTIRGELNKDQRDLHRQLMKMRNKVLAHSDAEMMRMVARTFPIDLKDGREFHALQTVFDEGLTFIGDKLRQLDELLHAAFAIVYRKLLEEAQEQPNDFNLVKDYIGRED
jgi:hypothetical protein